MDMQLPSVASGMFPGGPFDLVEHFMSNANAALGRHLAVIKRTMRTTLSIIRLVTQFSTDLPRFSRTCLSGHRYARSQRKKDGSRVLARHGLLFSSSSFSSSYGLTRLTRLTHA